MKKMIIAVLLIASIVSLTGCDDYEHYTTSEAYSAKYDVKNKANDFEVMRRITVCNTRTDALVLQIEGYFSLSNNSSNELEVTLKEDEDTYRIDYIYLNENVMYVVEDITPAEAHLEDVTVHFGGHGFEGVRGDE